MNWISAARWWVDSWLKMVNLTILKFQHNLLCLDWNNMMQKWNTLGKNLGLRSISLGEVGRFQRAPPEDNEKSVVCVPHAVEGVGELLPAKRLICLRMVENNALCSAWPCEFYIWCRCANSSVCLRIPKVVCYSVRYGFICSPNLRADENTNARFISTMVDTVDWSQ